MLKAIFLNLNKLLLLNSQANAKFLKTARVY